MPDFPILLLAMALTACFCRIAGFVLMQILPTSPRMEAALRATPLSVMAAIAALALASGGLAEGLALAAVVGLTFLLRNDVLAAIAGVGIVALLRWAGV